jgi:hypothetical protein
MRQKFGFVFMRVLCRAPVCDLSQQKNLPKRQLKIIENGKRKTNHIESEDSMKRGRKTQFVKCNTCLMIDKSRTACFGKKYIGTKTGMECTACCKEHDGSIKNNLAKRCRACCVNGHFTREVGSVQSLSTPSKLPCNHITGGISVVCVQCSGCSQCCGCDPDKEVQHLCIGEEYTNSIS